MKRGLEMRALVILLSMLAALAACSRSIHQKDFATAEEAAQSLVAATRSGDTHALLQILGPEAGPTVDSGDAVQDKNVRERFVHAYETRHSLVADTDGSRTLQVGADEWPFPYPLVQSNGRWRFDGSRGSEEIIDRRVGANELSTIQACLAFVDAEREYYIRNPEEDPLLHYAQKILSTDGRKDGLYWPTTGNEAQSPLGERFARARAEGYFAEGSRKGEPFHGYIYRLLTAQGSGATGGALDYMVGDKLLGGFALIAYPAEYGSSGVKSFIVNQNGVVYSRDLGAETPAAAAAIKTFDPGESWGREAAIEQQAAR
jgi:hypothetical protein